MKHKLDVLFRLIAAILGGYLVSIGFSIAFVPVLVWLNLCSQAEAVMVATMLSYIVYFTVIIVSFCRRSPWLLWRDMSLSLCLLAATYWGMGAL
ncbi:hypothetical protein [Paraglaciecola sp.]|uniref:hypothetical protein n=1 Tax=Paraglaciecola sp. TaxID=1920173 RepID=UPI0032653902